MKSLLLFAMLLQAPLSSNSRISGRVITIPNAGAMPASLVLRTMGNAPGKGKSVPVAADGKFEISGVTPGEYDLNIEAGAQTYLTLARFASGQFAMVQSAVGPGRNFTFRDGDVTDFEIKVPTGLAGRIVTADGSSVAPGSVIIESTTPVTATNARSGRAMHGSATSSPGGDFVLPVFPGDNRISFELLPVGYTVKSAVYGSLDLQRNPLTLESAPASTIVVTLDRADRR